MPPPRIRIPSLSNLSLVPSLRQPLPSTCLRSFSSSPQQNASHGPSYDPPSGWLFGVPPGQKYQKEGWENIWIYGFWGSLLVLGVGGWVWREDTSIQTWALEEARRRLEIEGILPDPTPSSGQAVTQFKTQLQSETSSIEGK